RRGNRAPQLRRIEQRLDIAQPLRPRAEITAEQRAAVPRATIPRAAIQRAIVDRAGIALAAVEQIVHVDAVARAAACAALIAGRARVGDLAAIVLAASTLR